MNDIVKDIIKVANASNKEEQSKILILSQLLDKTEYLINVVNTPYKDLNETLDQQRRWILMDVEDRIRRSEAEVLDRIRFVLKNERDVNEF